MFRPKIFDVIEQLRADAARSADTLENLTSRIDGLQAGFGRLDSDLVHIGESLTGAYGRLDADLVGSVARIDATLRLLDPPSPEQAVANGLAAMIAADADAGESPVETVLPHPFSNQSREEWTRSVLRWRQHAAALLASYEARPCPACLSARSAFLFKSYDDYPFHECLDCGAWYCPLRVNADLFERYFEVCPEGREDSDYMLSQDETAAVRDADMARFGDYYRELQNLRGGAGGALIDVGCGVGTSLDAAAALGFDACGVEISDAARTAAANRGRRVYKTLDDVPSRQFDVISLFESLEHMDRPDQVGAFAAARLAPGGLLAITVPNLDSPVIRSMRGDSLHIHGGQGFAGHINLFNKDTLASFLGRHGFEIVRAQGQFSMNVFELAGYHLGAWRGARDYLNPEKSGVALPAKAHGLLNMIGPTVSEWERKFAMGPILRVIARRK